LKRWLINNRQYEQLEIPEIFNKTPGHHSGAIDRRENLSLGGGRGYRGVDSNRIVARYFQYGSPAAADIAHAADKYSKFRIVYPGNKRFDSLYNLSAGAGF
jgi:hypothetical protein